MSNEQPADLTQLQRHRLALLELCACFIGEIRRQYLVSRFGIQSASASRDQGIYKGLGPSNIDYDPKGKSYVLGPDFRPVFNSPGAGAVVADAGFWRWYADAAQGVGGEREPVTAHASGSGCAGERDPYDSPGVSTRHRVPLHLQRPH
jgi:hypothetical protein